MTDSTAFKIRIKPHYSYIVHHQNAIELRSGVWNPTSYMIHDEQEDNVLYKIITSLDGRYSVEELSNRLGINKKKIKSVVDHLAQLGVIESDASTAFQKYLDQVAPHLTCTKDDTGMVLPQCPTLLLGEQKLTKPLKSLLTQSIGGGYSQKIYEENDLLAIINSLDNNFMRNGIELEKVAERFKSWKGYFIVFIQHQVNPDLSLKLNRIFYHLNIPWIQSAIDGPFVLVGPTFTKTLPCFECFETRISMNMKDNVSYQRYKKAMAKKQCIQSRDFTIHPILQSLLISHTAMEIVNYLLTGRSFTQKKVLSIYLPTMEITFNEFLRNSHCRTCGKDSLRDSTPLYFDFSAVLDE